MRSKFIPIAILLIIITAFFCIEYFFLIREKGEKIDIPIYEITISDKNYEKLISDLPSSGVEYVEAKIKLPDGEGKDVKVKFRGVNNWHWKYPKKSWRIKFEDIWEGKEKINLINSRHKTQILHSLGMYLGAKAGVLSPSCESVALYVNGEYQGVYENIEQVDQYFLQNHNRKPGDIYYGETGNLKINVFHDSNAWERIPPMSKKDRKAEGKIEALIEIIKDEPDDVFQEQIGGILDTDKMARYIAILNLIGSTHIKDNKNFKIYYNPAEEKFEPIVWDIFEWVPEASGVSRGITIASNTLFKRLFGDPSFVKKKNEYMWKFANSFASAQEISGFVDQRANLIKDELELDPGKNYSYPVYNEETEVFSFPTSPLGFEEWLQSIQDFKYWYEKRIADVLSELQKLDYIEKSSAQ